MKIILFLSLLLAACSPKTNVENKRVFNNTQEIFGDQQSSLISPLVSALENAPRNACERLGELTKQNKKGLVFSYFDQLKFAGQTIKGASNIAESPLLQFILGEKFLAGNTKDFYKNAKAERKKGNVSFLQWMAIEILNAVGILEIVQYPTINEKLQEAFPGIYGGDGEIKNALLYQLLSKIEDPNELLQHDMNALSAILTAKLPLFPESASWQTLAEETKINLASFIQALKKPGITTEEKKERVCAGVLAHYHFAQLLTIKGYMKPAWKSSKNSNRVQLEELSSSNKEFFKLEASGGFYDPTLRASIVLNEDQITKYNPAQRPLNITAETPNGNLQEREGTLNDSLAMMETMLYGFEASSPAAPWLVEEREYLYGDIQATAENKVILPGQAHALSLGLLGIGFKNLAANYIKQVNSKGVLAGKDDIVAGIALAAEVPAEGSQTVKIHLADIIRLTKVVSYLENSLRNFTKGSAEKWQRMNKVYEPKVLASLLGDSLFTKEELKKILTEDERKNILKDNLQKLKLPLAILLVQMGTTEKGCFSEANWDLSTGIKTPMAGCGEEVRAGLKEALTILAHDARSPLLMKKAQSL